MAKALTKAELKNFNECKSYFVTLAEVVPNTVTMRAMRKAGKYLTSQVLERVRGTLRRSRTKQLTGDLERSIGMRLKKYQKGAGIFVAVGPTYPTGAHGLLVERGHRIVVGGTAAREAGGTPGLTAGGQRFIKAQGYTKKGKNWLNSAGKRAAKFGEEFMGRKIRGGGKVALNKVPPYPFLQPVFEVRAEQTKRLIFQEHKELMEKEAKKIAKDFFRNNP